MSADPLGLAYRFADICRGPILSVGKVLHQIQNLPWRIFAASVLYRVVVAGREIDAAYVF